ncbi:MAG TPA: hypothetical protein VI488_21845, partial [Candidatus Angelobacter sp.]
SNFSSALDNPKSPFWRITAAKRMAHFRAHFLLLRSSEWPFDSDRRSSRAHSALALITFVINLVAIHRRQEP